MSKAKKDEKEMYMEMQMLEAQMNAVQEQMQRIEQKIGEVKELKKGVDDVIGMVDAGSVTRVYLGERRHNGHGEAETQRRIR